ncbi:MAG TPA: TfoX/Sxy family protein [Candidatus Limnocylindrales bacterium]|jgi:TfoX/Sxy family transcriptional regulator of competence genes|nr:TfoX/Sxy family protein [Candidatus Limnocylindrales bacterium]
MAKREMPSFDKSPAELVARFDAAATRFPDAQRRKMFGYPALFICGNLVTGLFADSWMIRLVPDDLAELMAMPGASAFEPMPGKPMKGYARLPADVVADEARLDAWIRRAIALGRSLPPK